MNVAEAVTEMCIFSVFGLLVLLACCLRLLGSLHQAQYCERLKSIMDYLGDKLELDELTTIWRMQDGQHQVVMDNIHMLIACAAQRFTPDQLHHLFHLIKSSWTTENNRSREKLLVLVGKLGKEDRGGKISSQVSHCKHQSSIFA